MKDRHNELDVLVHQESTEYMNTVHMDNREGKKHLNAHRSLEHTHLYNTFHSECKFMYM